METLRIPDREAARVRERFPDRVLIVITRRAITDPKMDKSKFVVPRDLTIGNLLLVVRRRVMLRSSDALFLFPVESKQMLSAATTVGQAADAHAERSGVLYLGYTQENAFGGD